MGEKIKWRWKVSWIKKKRSCMCKQSKKRSSPATSISGQMCSHFFECGTSAHVTIVWEDGCCKSEHPPFILLPLRFYWWAHNTLWVIFLVSWGRLCHLPVSCPPPTYWFLWGSEERLDAVQALFRNRKNTAMLSTLFKPQHYTDSYE